MVDHTEDFHAVPLELATAEQIADELGSRDLHFALCVGEGDFVEVRTGVGDPCENLNLLGDSIAAIAASNGFEVSRGGQILIRGRSNKREVVAWSLLAFFVGVAIAETIMLGMR